jgi:hypothetical protein
LVATASSIFLAVCLGSDASASSFDPSFLCCALSLGRWRGAVSRAMSGAGAASWHRTDEGEAFPAPRPSTGPTLEDLTIDESLDDVQRIARYGASSIALQRLVRAQTLPLLSLLSLSGSPLPPPLPPQLLLLLLLLLLERAAGRAHEYAVGAVPCARRLCCPLSRRCTCACSPRCWRAPALAHCRA